MDQNYDVIVLGTGLKECMLSGLMSVEGRAVLHMDRNDYYGGACASLTLEQLFEKFADGADPPEEFGRSRDYAVDLIPKFLMANGGLVKMLVYTGVNRYLEFKSLSSCWVMRDGDIHKVPATDVEALKSSLVGFFSKRRLKNFFQYVAKYDFNVPKTMKGRDIREYTARQMMEWYSLDASTMEFIGHTVALYRDDSYLEEPAAPFFERIRLYATSLERYGQSPFLYPLYGLSEAPQGFARLSAIYGGTYMLRKPIDEVLYNDDGRVCGVVSEGETAECSMVIADPSYFPDKVKRIGQVIRCICVLSHPIPNTNDAESCQIIIPQAQANRSSDIYISCVSFAHNVAPDGRYIAIVSTTVETDNPLAELDPALALLGAIDATFPSVSDVFEPTNNPAKDGVYITSSYDATSHFETTTNDVFAIYEAITGHPIDFDNPPRPGGDEQ